MDFLCIFLVYFFTDFGVWLYQHFDKEQLLVNSAAQSCLHHKRIQRSTR